MFQSDSVLFSKLRQACSANYHALHLKGFSLFRRDKEKKNLFMLHQLAEKSTRLLVPH